MCQSRPIRSFHVLAGLTTIGDRHRLRALCANAEKHHQSAAAAALSGRMALFSRRSGSSRRGGRGGKRKLSSRRTWTVSFVCLASRHQSRIPSSTEKQVLFHAGLGIKKIKLDLEDKEQDVLEKITCGDGDNDGEIKGFGFEIMYCVSGVKGSFFFGGKFRNKRLEFRILSIMFFPSTS